MWKGGKKRGNDGSQGSRVEVYRRRGSVGQAGSGSRFIERKECVENGSQSGIMEGKVNGIRLV